MNKRVKKKWLKALETGVLPDGRPAPQTTNRLGKVDVDPRSNYKEGFCCLGVLCEIAVSEGVIDPPGKIAGKEYTALQYGPPGGNDTGSLPSVVWNWAGMPSKDPVVHGRSLASHNDSGKSFAEIAGLIRTHL